MGKTVEDYSKCKRCSWELGCSARKPSTCAGPMTSVDEEVSDGENEDLVEGIPGPIDSDCVG